MIAFDGIQNYFCQTTGLKFVWENEPREILQKPYGVLKLGTCSVIGRDDIYDSHLVGSREIVVQAQVFSRSFKPTECARYYLEKARTMLRTFKHPDLVFDEAHPIVDLDLIFDNRQESRAAFDAVFRYSEVADLSHLSSGFFDHVEYSYES